MRRSESFIPAYCKHRASGQAVVTISGRDHYLGLHGSKASRVEYDRLIGEWLAEGRPATRHAGNDYTVAEILKRFNKWAEGYYRKNGKPTGEYDNLGHALKPVRELYGNTLAIHFGPLALAGIQQRFVEQGTLCRKEINRRVFSIRRAFRWAVSKELLPPSVIQALETVPGLKKDRTEARESKRIGAVPDAIVDATIKHLPAVVADMVRFQRLTGARPGEVCMLRPCDVDRSGKVWRYRPSSHKTEHHDQGRIVFIGPKAKKFCSPTCFATRKPIASHRPKAGRGGKPRSARTARRRFHRRNATAARPSHS